MMRRLLLLSFVPLMLVAMAGPVSALGLNISTGMSFSGEFESVDETVDARNGYDLGLELTLPIASSFEVGVGYEYGLPRDLDEGSIDDFRYHRIYAGTRIYFLGRELPIYLTGRAGWTQLDANGSLGDALEGKESWSVGAGFELVQKWKLEVLMDNVSGEIDLDETKADFDYKSYSAKVLFSF